jgi:hypothetical protein
MHTLGNSKLECIKLGNVQGSINSQAKDFQVCCVSLNFVKTKIEKM